MAARLDGAMMAAAPAAALLALYWQAVLSMQMLVSAVVLAGAWGAWAMRGRAGSAGSMLGRVMPGRTGARPSVSAIRMDRDGAFHLRMHDGWHPAEWIAAWRGPRWLTLRARVRSPHAAPDGLLPPDAPAAAGGCVTFTVWQDGLPAEAWRRTCVLASRRLCRAPARRPVGAP